MHHDDDDRREVRRARSRRTPKRGRAARRCTRDSTDDPLACSSTASGCAAASGETAESVSPATGEVDRHGPAGRPHDAERAIAAANRAFDGWSRLTAFERAAKMHAVGDAIERRRDDLASTLTLDQGKPLRAEAYDEVDELVEYWRRRPRTPSASAASCRTRSRAGKRVMLCAARAARSGSSRPGTGRTRCRPSCSRRRWPPATPSCGRRRRRRRSARSRSPSAWPRPTSRPASSTSSPGRGRWSATRSPATPAPAQSPSSAPRRRAARSRPPRPARPWSSRWAATARSSSWTTRTSSARSRPWWRPASCAPARAARRASGSSCTRPCATSSSTGWRAP